MTCFLIKTNNFVLFVCLLGCSRKNPHPHPKDGILEILAEWGGAKTLEIQVGAGVELEEVFCRGHFNQ